jgi:phosphohistidine phosphatase
LSGLHLILFRHGKSGWDEPALDDVLRPLAPRGLRDVPEMGRRLARRGPLPERIVTSTAVRALSSAQAVARELDYRADGIVEAPELYLASTRTLLEIVRGTPAPVRTLMLVGHNPGFTDFANQHGQIRLDNLPTAGMLCIGLEANKWSAVQPASGRLVWYDCPKRQP